MAHGLCSNLGTSRSYCRPAAATECSLFVQYGKNRIASQFFTERCFGFSDGLVNLRETNTDGDRAPDARLGSRGAAAVHERLNSSAKGARCDRTDLREVRPAQRKSAVVAAYSWSTLQLSLSFSPSREILVANRGFSTMNTDPRFPAGALRLKPRPRPASRLRRRCDPTRPLKRSTAVYSLR
jgi:hypothetical protein